ncbi:MAG: TerB family tellurite resistance protein [Bacteroidota bacterium]
MAKYGKWIGGGLGWILGGGSPIGAILGFAVGSMFDASAINVQKGVNREYYRHHTGPGDFAASLLVLTAVVMKADGKIMRSELDYVKNFFQRQFGPQIAAQQIHALQQILKQDIPVKKVCDEIRYYMEHPLRLQLIHFLFGIAAADGKVDRTEVQVIAEIANYLGISEKDFESLKAMFYKDTGSAYKILEIEKDASDEEVKKAYRKMAVKYHPDKVSSLGEEYQKSAKEKFQKVQEAYEAIKKERGMS